MRWANINPINGSTRIIKKFAFKPIKVALSNEVRWLEFVTIRQRYDSNFATLGWHNLNFIDNIENETKLDRK